MQEERKARGARERRKESGRQRLSEEEEEEEVERQKSREKATTIPSTAKEKAFSHSTLRTPFVAARARRAGSEGSRPRP